MNRIDRISAILIQLQTKRVVKAQDIADRFAISLRTVYRDMKSLEEAGIPIMGEAGLGYSLVDGFRLPPVMFTREEAAAFLTAEKLISQLTDPATAADYSTAMYKIKAVLRASEKDFLEEIEPSITVLKSRSQRQNPLQLNLIQSILKSVAEKKVIEINYFTHYRQEGNKRQVESVGVFFLDSYWHLIAFCRLRNDYRDFRLDRIQGLTFTEEYFSKEHPGLKQYLQTSSTERVLNEVVITVSSKVHAYLDSQKYYNGFVSETKTGDQVAMHFLTPSLEHFARWYLMFADEASIQKPEALREKVRNIVTSIKLDEE